jgi:hypothetical protein
MADGGGGRRPAGGLILEDRHKPKVETVLDGTETGVANVTHDLGSVSELMQSFNNRGDNY